MTRPGERMNEGGPAMRRMWHWYLYRATTVQVARIMLWLGTAVGFSFGFWIGRVWS